MIVVAETKPDDGHAFGNEANGHIDNSVKKEIAMNGHGPSNVQVLVMDDKKDKAKEKKQSESTIAFIQGPKSTFPVEHVSSFMQNICLAVHIVLNFRFLAIMQN